MAFIVDEISKFERIKLLSLNLSMNNMKAY